MGHVYKITNLINNKVYIGKTLKTVDERYKSHIHDSKNVKYQKRPLYIDINKYGYENFLIESLYESNNNDILCEKEKEYIKFFKSNNLVYGYNNTFGGDGRSTLDINEKELICYYLFESNFSLTKTSNHFRIDRKTTKTILEKYRITPLSSKEAHIKFLGKKIAQCNIETDEIINVFNSIGEAADYLGQKVSNIKHALRGRNKSAYGFKWKYYNGIEEENNHENKTKIEGEMPKTKINISQ